jgi:hypothetical protein
MDFFECLGISFVVFDDLCFWVLDPLYFVGCNFLISNLFWMIISMSDALRGGVQVLFGYQKQQSPPQVCPECLSVQSLIGLPYGFVVYT